MPNNIQTIIDKFDKEFPETTIFQHRVFYIGTGHSENRDILIGKDIKQFLKDSLTSLLDNIEEEVVDKIDELMVYAKQNKKDYETVNEANFGIAQLKGIVNIINSHR